MTIIDELQKAPPYPYGQPLINYVFGKKDIFVISDLHLAAGTNQTGNCKGTENFFADQSFARFIDHLISINKADPALLIINGDLVDFLRIDNIPKTDRDILKWKAILKTIGIEKTESELRDSISKKELIYGLKTDDYKSVWKLYICATGHRDVFSSLAKWLLSGHKLIIVKGNHDLEWYWEPVRAYMNILMVDNMALFKNELENAVQYNIFASGLTYIDDSFIIDVKIYVEHGHRYENFTAVDGDAVLNGSKELNLPFGSFFNRYLINKVELAYPYIDNVRPSENILPILIRERFPLALKMLFHYVPFALLIIPKRQYRHALKYLLHFLLIAAIPIALSVFMVIKLLTAEKHGSSDTNFFVQQLLNILKGLAPLILSYFLSRLYAMLKLSPPGSLFKNAREIFSRPALQNIQVVTFGHTHDPEQTVVPLQNKKYYNTGTWIPVFETDAADIRPDKTYTFLHLIFQQDGNVASTTLRRWNDDAMRIDALPLIERE